MTRLALYGSIATMLFVIYGPSEAQTPLKTPPARAIMADDLQRALLVEAEWLAAVATRDGSLEAYPQARAALLPQVGVNAQRSQNNTDSSTQTAVGPLNRTFDNYPASSASIQARQALFRPKSWANLAQSRAQIRYAEHVLDAARQDLSLKLLSVHAELFSAKLATDTLVAQVNIQRQLSEALRRQFAGGDSTRVDLEVSRSREYQLNAQVAQARLELENLSLARQSFTGGSKIIEPIPFRRDAVFKLPMPILASLEAWIATALKENPSVLAQVAAIEAAIEEVRKAGYDHYPTADLYASRSASKSAMDNTIGTEFRTTQVGVQLSIPIYAGGAVDSQIRQAQAGVRRAEQQLEATKQKLRLQIDRDFRTLEAAREEVNAQIESLKALELALSAAVKGRTAGISILSDELNIKSQIEATRRNIARSTANALIAWGRLMAATNKLQQDQLVEVERQTAQSPS